VSISNIYLTITPSSNSVNLRLLVLVSRQEDQLAILLANIDFGIL
jgi:hypothetical protein